jgi:hypothetical protein
MGIACSSSAAPLVKPARGVVRLASLVELWQRVNRTMISNPYRGFRNSAEAIQQAVWLYHCFSLSL